MYICCSPTHTVYMYTYMCMYYHLTFFSQSGREALGMGLENEVLREKHVAEDGVDVDENYGQHCGEQDGDDIPGDAPHDVLQSLFSIHYVKHLQNRVHVLSERYAGERKENKCMYPYIKEMHVFLHLTVLP